MSHYKIVFTPRAERQITSLYSYIADHSNEATADRFVGGIVDWCRSLADFPERGTRRDDVRPHLRTIGYRRRVTVAFSVHSDDHVVAIHGVFYGGQDFERLLRTDEGGDWASRPGPETADNSGPCQGFVGKRRISCA